MKNWRYQKSGSANSKMPVRGLKAPFKWAGSKNRMFERSFPIACHPLKIQF